jgi:hypothetical protein
MVKRVVEKHMGHAYDRVKKCKFRTPLSSPPASSHKSLEWALVYALVLAVESKCGKRHDPENSQIFYKKTSVEIKVEIRSRMVGLGSGRPGNRHRKQEDPLRTDEKMVRLF